MPNYCFNRIEFDPADVEKVRALVVSEQNEFDFNRIIPMPESLNIVAGSTTSDAETLLRYEKLHRIVPDTLRKFYPDEGEEPDPSVFYGAERTPKTLPELRVFARIVQANKEKYGCTDWYSWRNIYWNTKWNACDVCWDGNTVSFDTAWSDPVPVLKELSFKLGIRFRATAEEESLAFCSITEYYNGDLSEYEDAEGIEGLVLLGYSREEILERYDDDDEYLEEVRKELDELM